MEERESVREKEEKLDVFDENGHIRPWASMFLQKIISSSRPGKGTGEAEDTEQAKRKATNNPCSSTLEKKENSNHSNKLHTYRHGEDVKGSEGEYASERSKKSGHMKQQLFDLIQKAVRQGESSLQDEVFLQQYARFFNTDGEIINEGDQRLSTADEKNSSSDLLDVEVSPEEDAMGKKKALLGPAGNTTPVKTTQTGNKKGPVREVQNFLACTESGTENTVHVPIPCKPQPKLSFAEATKNSSSVPVNSVLKNPPPTCNTNIPSQNLSDDSPLYRIEPEFVAKRIEMCSHSIVGRLSLSKGDTPWPLRKLREILEGIWNLKSEWRLISLGRGYFHILLLNNDEWERVWARGSLFLKPGILRLQRWTLEFDPSKEKTTFAQVWFRLYHLPWGLWDPNVIAGIARKVGTPIRFDKATVEGDFGHYARVLLDVDLSRSFMTNIHVECGNARFEVKLIPENLPQFCKGCNSIGHAVTNCRNMQQKGVISKPSLGVKGGELFFKTAASIGINKSITAGSSEIPDVAPIQKEKCANAAKLSNEGPHIKAQVPKGPNGSDSGQSDKVVPTVEGSIGVSETSLRHGNQLNQDRPKSPTLRTRGEDNILIRNKFEALNDANDELETSMGIQSSKRGKKPLTATDLRKKSGGGIFRDPKRPSARPQSSQSQ